MQSKQNDLSSGSTALIGGVAGLGDSAWYDDYVERQGYGDPYDLDDDDNWSLER